MVQSVSYPTGKRNTSGATTPRVDGWLLAAVIALYVARPLVTSDAADYQGDGALFVMLWLLLAAGWAVSAARSRRVLRIAVIDPVVGGLLVWYSVASLVAMTGGRPRPALNLMWEWMALGVGYFLVRQLARTPVQRRTLTAAMVCLASGLSAMGYFQFFVGAPRDRAQYERIKDDPAMMQQVVGQYFPPGSAERRRFEDRLYSDEPTATFALANSLAGFLAPWLVVLIGAAGGSRSPSGLRRFLWCSLLPVAMIGGCLWLTKSRSGWLAAALGIVVLGVTARMGRYQRDRLPVLWIVLAGLVISAAAWLGGFDRAVWTQAERSLRYRIEYWRATVAIIGDHPWLGCGPGQFQDAYTRYKLAGASEEIRDPHNFLLEVWATAGTPAGVLMIAVLVLLAITIARDSARVPRKEPPVPQGDQVRSMPRPLALGLVSGFVLAVVAGPLFGFGLRLEYLLVGAIGAAATGWIVRPWISLGAGQAHLALAGATTLCIHLLAAGGIAYPGVAGTLWILLAIGVNDKGVDRQILPRPVTAWLFVAVAAAGAATCFATFYRPVLASRAHRIAALSVSAAQDHTRRSRQLLAAAEADPLDARSAQMLAAHRYEQYLVDPSASKRQELESAINAWLRLAPRSSAAWGQVGRWWLSIHAQTGDAAALDRAVRCLSQSVRWYPTSAARQADYAIALYKRGQPDRARARAATSLRLEQALIDAGHSDKQLPAGVRRQLRRILRSNSN